MTQTHPTRRLLTLGVTLMLLLAACGGGKNDDSGGNGDTPADVGDPVRGGSVTYGLEAETGDGWCLPESQLAISGEMVAQSIYDTLTAPNADGEYVPSLAKSVEPNEDFTSWAITLRDGVTFHDGSPLTAEVVKNNIDAYRGQYDGRNPLLFVFVLADIDTVEVTGDLEVTVTTKVPWVSFPAFLNFGNRMGIMAQAQLDDAESCDRKLIGTGPFKMVSWEKDREFVAEKNPDYWQMAPDGEPYPYLEEIHFTPIVEAEQRVNALEAGNIDLMLASGANEFASLDGLADAGTVDNRDSDEFAEVAFVQVNASKPPFDDARVRRALALSIDRDDYNEVINQGMFTMASGPFGPGSIGYLDDAGYPAQDVDEAKSLIAEYEAENGPLPALTFQATPSAGVQQAATYLQQSFSQVGVDIELATVQQDKQIDNAVSGEYDLQIFRNYPGGDPDLQYIWFKSDSPVNFGRINDPEIDQLLDQGRSEPDPEKRATIYEDINRQFGEDTWSLWLNWTTWRVSAQPSVHGYTLDTLPTLPDGSAPFTGLANGHPTMGLWIES